MKLPTTTKFPPKLLLFFVLILGLNLLQSSVTELIQDEAYYWFYAQNLAWGYFDHPPMVAGIIWLGKLFFSGELGIRFISCLLQIGTFLILWSCIDNPIKKKYTLHFTLLVFSMTLVNAYGFLTLPDTPLLFFTAVFLWVYKRFLQKQSIGWAIGLGLIMGALMYSKYHAVLVIVFVLLSNLSLLKNPKAWLAVAVALVSYIPHFIWLFENDFVSIQYHLFERPNRPYDFNDYTLGFLINLVAIFGLTFPWVYRSLFKTKNTDTFTKALTYLVYGILLFFFISSFNRRIQTQWIVVISIPMIILVFNKLLTDKTTRKWIFRMGIVNAIILLVLRVGLVYPALFPITYETHGNKTWIADLKEKSEGVPIVFENSYHQAPLYSFYANVPSFSLNTIEYRQNQYDITSTETDFQGKNIVYVSKDSTGADFKFTKLRGGDYYGKRINKYQSGRKLRCIIPENENFSLADSKTHTMLVYNPYTHDIPKNELVFNIAYTNTTKKVKEVVPLSVSYQNNTAVLKAKDSTMVHFKLPKTTVKSPGYFKLSIADYGLPSGINSTTITLQ